MAHTVGHTRLARKQAQTMDELITEYIKEMKLMNGLNRQRIFTAWDEVSGAAGYTVGKYLKGGVLYCNIGSSVVRSRLMFQKDIILEKINEFLKEDELFVKDEAGSCYVRSLVLR